MSLIDRHHLLTYVKWLTFLFCTIGFVYKVSGSVFSYFSKETGTKIDLKANYEIELPSLAVCRHPKYIALPYNQKLNLSIDEAYGLTVDKLRWVWNISDSSNYWV